MNGSEFYLGDLLFSCLKRKLGIKDFSHILPGHGGILDRFDNTLFVAPFFYAFANHDFLF
ncbi:MAG: phosphatidate cytidylyltransferase [Cyanothece sp. SIO1E1]|nr:phosphatidate cytidylyltransferase [Cyanothece sp. SIO1E1]